MIQQQVAIHLNQNQHEPSVTVSYNFETEEGGTRLTYRFVMISRGMMRLLHH